MGKNVRALYHTSRQSIVTIAELAPFAAYAKPDPRVKK